MSRTQNLSNDFFASIIVFLIAFPLCLGVALASGVDPIKGIFAGIIGGAVVGLFSGAPLQISGPSPGLAVMVFHVVDLYGPQALIPLGLTIGLFQIATGSFKVAHFFQATPPALLKAMLSGIGVLICMAQLYILFDLKMSSNGLTNLSGLPAIFTNIFTGNLSTIQTHSGLIGLFVIVVLTLWSFGKHKIFEIIPGPLVAIMSAAVLTFALGLDIKMIQLPDDIMGQAFNLNYIEAFSSVGLDFYIYALGVAFVASAETLLCVSAVDKMAKTTSNYNKQIVAQGLGNITSGLVGAIPIVGVIVRSAANIEFGAKTQLSSILLGVWIGLFLLIPGVLGYIPIAALAGLLIYTGIKLFDFLHILNYIRKYNKTSLIFFSTFILTVAVDLLAGVATGFAIAVFILVYDVLKFDLEVQEQGDNKVLKFHGKLSFLNLPVVSKKLRGQDLDGVTNLEICLQEVEYLDPAINEHLSEFKDKLEAQGTKMEVHYSKFKIH